jgi:hypothetical protein
MSLTLQHNRKTFLTNHKTACPDLVAYHIYMHVLLGLSPKMAPIYTIIMYDSIYIYIIIIVVQYTRTTSISYNTCQNLGTSS